MKKFIITTAIGGLLFLVPLAFVVIVFGKAYKIMAAVAKPLSERLPVDSIAGVGLIEILAIVLMLLACFLAGLLARGAAARALYRKLDGVLSELIPGYTWTKTVVHNLGGETHTDQFKPVLVAFDDQTQVAFEMERGEGLVVVFIPGSPDVRSGSVAYVTPDRVRPLETSLLAVNRIMKHMGKGAAALLPAEPR